MTRQIVVFMENRPGSLSELTHVLADADVNVDALLIEGSVDFGAARLHVSNTQRAMKALREAGYQVQAGEALAVRMHNKPGELAECADRLRDARVNVESVFGTTTRNGEAEFVFMVDEPDRARKALGLDE